MGFLLPRRRMDDLLHALATRGYRVLGPQVRDGTLVLEDLPDAAALAQGWTDEQRPGHYRLHPDADSALGPRLGAQGWKPHFLVPELRVWRAQRDRTGLHVLSDEPAHPRLALLGVRPCDLAALAIQDRVLGQGAHPDPHYVARREDTFIIVAQCTLAGGTCFCASMGTGPKARSGFDLALTELGTGEELRLLVEVGSVRGDHLVNALALEPAPAADLRAAEELAAQAARTMGRMLDTNGIRELLVDRPEHPRWAQVAARCLVCTNCTLVCPTCFCTTLTDGTDLEGREATRTRHWDSCFNPGFSWIHGGSVRASRRARYRHWLTHKLATWWDQFGTPGCVGCGRCITWCPVGIDITQEVAAIRGTP